MKKEIIIVDIIYLLQRTGNVCLDIIKYLITCVVYLEHKHIALTPILNTQREIIVLKKRYLSLKPNILCTANRSYKQYL